MKQMFLLSVVAISLAAHDLKLKVFQFLSFRLYAWLSFRPRSNNGAELFMCDKQADTVER